MAGFSGSNGHTDPGPNFDVDAFVARVAAQLTPAAPIDWTALARLASWQKRVTDKPLRYRDRGPDVQLMNDLLLQKHLIKKSGDRYGLKSWSAVHKFKQANNWTKGTATGQKFGGAAAIAILK